MLDFCFFENDDRASVVAADVLKNKEYPPSVDDSYIRENPSLQFRSPHDLHEQFCDRLQFFIDALNLMGETHVA